jgi:hypothetical protein
MIGEINTLHPAFKMAVDQILSELRRKGWNPYIASGMRTNEQQDAIFAQGRMALNDVNALRMKSGLPSIPAAENVIRTRARGGHSNHNLTQSLYGHGRSAVDLAYGYAVDVANHPAVPDDSQFWKDLGHLAKQHGCVWGGDWDFKDLGHIEMKVIDSAPRTSVVV